MPSLQLSRKFPKGSNSVGRDVPTTKQLLGPETGANPKVLAAGSVDCREGVAPVNVRQGAEQFPLVTNCVIRQKSNVNKALHKKYGSLCAVGIRIFGIAAFGAKDLGICMRCCRVLF